MKLFRLVMVTALLVGGLAILPTQSLVSASDCINANGNGDFDLFGGPFSLPAGTTIEVMMATDPGAGTAIDIFAYGAFQVNSVSFSTPHTVSYTLPTDATDVFIFLDWQYNGLASNTWFATGGCGAGRDMVFLPTQAVVGTFVANTELLSVPSSSPEAGTGLVMEIGQTLYVYGVDSTGMYYQVLLSGSLVWVPVSSMRANYDEVWNGTPLPNTVVD